MNIALDGMSLVSQLTGVGHYTLELARNLALAAPTDSFTLVSPQPMLPSTLEAIQNPSVPNLSHVTLARGALNRRWWSVGLPRYLSKSAFDLFHGTNYEIPLWSRRPSVVTIHDLSLLLHSDAHERHLVRRARWRLPLMVKAASKIITPSNSVKTEVCETFKVESEKVSVTPEAPRPSFRRSQDGEASKLRTRFGITEDFVLCVGTIEPRKNLRRVVDAFERLLRTTSLSPKLVIAGGQGWLMDDFISYIRGKGLQDEVCLTGYLEDQDLGALYSSCKAFVYPSLYEGFGLPPLEAMACGAPVICSRIPALIETVGTAARLIDPCNVDDLGQAMFELLSDERVQEHYARLGTAHVQKFSWEQTALKTLEVYREAQKKRKGAKT
jgi:glycosyltransferase involved in cell wall biosynthesis